MFVYVLSESIQLLMLTGQYVFKGISYFWPGQEPEKEKEMSTLEMGKRLQLVEDKLEMLQLLEKYDIKIKD